MRSGLYPVDALKRRTLEWAVRLRVNPQRDPGAGHASQMGIVLIEGDGDARRRSHERCSSPSDRLRHVPPDQLFVNT